MEPGGGPSPRWGRRLGWMALIWAASVAALAAAAMVFRLLMSLAGLTV